MSVTPLGIKSCGAKNVLLVVGVMSHFGFVSKPELDVCINVRGSTQRIKARGESQLGNEDKWIFL